VTSRADRLIAAGMSGAEARLKADWFEQLEAALAQDGVTAGRARAYWIPGRLEFVGKHTDYAGGRSLCCAIERGICLLAAPRTDCRLRVRDIRSGDVLRTAVDADATRMPTCSASAWRVMTATIGSAVRVTTEPSSETVCPVQSFMKSACRHSDRAVTSIGRAA